MQRTCGVVMGGRARVEWSRQGQGQGKACGGGGQVSSAARSPRLPQHPPGPNSVPKLRPGFSGSRTSPKLSGTGHGFRLQLQRGLFRGSHPLPRAGRQSSEGGRRFNEEKSTRQWRDNDTVMAKALPID
jgi:hypothetical protein